MKRRTYRLGALAGAFALVTTTMATPATAGPLSPPDRDPVAVGRGGAVVTVDPDATSAGMEMLRSGGNAVDAAIAAAAALGVTEPYSAGFGGGGYFVYYEAATGRVHTLDGRETAPAAMGEDAFLEDGAPIPFAEAVTSGLSVGVPGTPATWEHALDEWGRKRPATVLRPAIELAEEGFVVDETFRSQTRDNAERFADFPATAELFLPGGAPPEVGTVLRNPDLADTYRAFAREGAAVLEGDIGADIVATVTDPPVAPDATREVRAGLMTTDDLAAYELVERAPTHVDYRGLDVYGMPPSSSGGSTVGEALNILSTFDPAELSQEEIRHVTLEASKLAYADRNVHIGDPDHVDVPLERLLSPEYAAQRACHIDTASVLAAPVAPGDLDAGAGCAEEGAPAAENREGPSTTHLVTADRWGNVVSYTLTIEQTGGSAITVPGRGFILNNELTDFDFQVSASGAGAANLPGPGKRPRSSMAPTIVLRDGEPWLALGSPGGATIITTVLQVLVDRVDAGRSLPEAVAAPRLSQRNAERVQAEPAFFGTPDEKALSELGHLFSQTAEIGAVAALEYLPDGRIQAVAEPERRGGGDAQVLRPSWR
ncbi:gamma-glutamyltransferase [Marinactinospora thermotolerans]|uniref:Glutathione hydrolase proenzyme n=1 Tax=Marinactinospora thermotolerans DSM 45154 TaxID=1122192 RepID=A0A1T4KPN5_9ACTN|nr:gamma-glutamyltransferase [Marinactinospora thermotolerans]SJZ44361.1 gamma-glutamyltranspeptidase / glutathione hydrolase [Marinactinospora thermotolerans DSM 45154]